VLDGQSPGGVSYYLLWGAGVRMYAVQPGLSLAWTAWLRLRYNTLPMKEVVELTV
jgi:hypothetical protein